VAQDTGQEHRWADRGWYLVLEFGHSKSDRYESAVRLARRGPGYLALLDENRALVHRNLYRGDDLRHFWRLLERVRAWKSTRLFASGDPVTADEAADGVECYLFFSEHSLCESRWREWPMFIGCPNTIITLRPDSPCAWFRRARGSGTAFRLDKAWLEERLEAGLHAYRCCPLLRPRRARELLRLLPAEIDPTRDHRWRVKGRASSRPPRQELRPASDDAYADYLADVFRSALAGR